MDYLVSALFLYSKLKCYVLDTFQQWNRDIPWVRYICTLSSNIVAYGRFYIKKYIYAMNCEPPVGNWMHTFTLLNSLDIFDCINYKEIYQPILEDQQHISIQNMEDNSISLIKYTNETTDHFISMVRPRMNISLGESNYSSISFLTVEYSHPDMKDAIGLELPKSIFLKENEILSPAFIYRWLLYQPREFVFDDKYTIQIIDNNIEMASLKYPEYIRILEKSYVVIEPEETPKSYNIQKEKQGSRFENDWDHWD